MKKKLVLPVLALVFVLLLGGAYVLYNTLSPAVAPSSLASLATPRPKDVNKTTGDTEAGIHLPTATASTNIPGTEKDTRTDTADEVPDSSLPLAPDFIVYDAEGDKLHFSDLTGKPIVLNFWASWCGPCRMEMPDFQEAFERLGDQVQFLMINMTDGNRETVAHASAFIEEQGFTFPVYYDGDANAASVYGIYSLPTTFFINSDGQVVTYASGAISADILKQGIDMIWNEAGPVKPVFPY